VEAQVTRWERRLLLGGAIVLAVVCSALFARAVIGQRAADYAHAQARAAILVSATVPRSDFADRTMLGWTGSTGQIRYWQALQRFRLISKRAIEAAGLTAMSSLGLIYDLAQTEAYLRREAVRGSTSAIRSRLYDMLGLAYFDDALLHAGQVPVGPALEAKAVGAFRQAVLADGTNEAAKTNLEFLLRKKLGQQQPPAGPTKPAQDTNRADNGTSEPSGLPSYFGAIGKKIRGGF
jgi:hypothetical protein